MEVTDLLNAMGLNPDEVKTVEDFKEKVTGEFIRRNAAHNDPQIVEQVVGSKMKKIENTVFKHVKELGVEITDEDLKDKKWTDDKIGVALTKLNEFHNNTVGELKAFNDKKGNEKFNELNEKFQSQAQKLKDFENLNKSLAEQIEAEKKNAHGQIKQFKINDAIGKAISSLPFKDGMTELEKTGFNSLINQKYEVDLDEEGKPFIYERETKKRIENKAVIGTFKSIEDVFKDEMIANKLDKKNPHQNQTRVDPFSGKNNNAGGGDDPANKGQGMPMSSKFLKKH